MMSTALFVPVPAPGIGKVTNYIRWVRAPHGSLTESAVGVLITFSLGPGPTSSIGIIVGMTQSILTYGLLTLNDLILRYVDKI